MIIGERPHDIDFKNKGLAGRYKVYVCLEDYTAASKEELSFNKDDLIILPLEQTEHCYLHGFIKNKKGKVPESLGRFRSLLVPDIIDEWPNVFHESAKRGQIDILEKCISYGLPVNCLDSSGSTALYWASRFGQEECVEWLLKYPEIDVNLRNKIGETPLHGASTKNHGRIVSMLLEAGAIKSISNRSFETPEDVSGGVESKAKLTTRVSSIDQSEYLFDDSDEDEQESEND